MNFRNLDLNLLRVLDAMLLLRNTTRVGESLGLSQPAVSSAVGRLRDLTGDPLFVREGNALVPTSFALGLRDPVRHALQGLEAAFGEKAAFDPARSHRAFTIGASDYFYEMLMPRLAAAVSGLAPNMRVKMLPAPTDTFPSMLTAEQFDLVLSIATEVPEWIESLPVFQAGNAVVAKARHPLLKGLKDRQRIPLDLFCGLPHIIFSVTREFSHFEDAALARIGRSRHVRFSVPSYFGVARVAAQTGLLGVVPTSFAESVAGKLGLRILRLPVEMPLVSMHLYWRRRDTPGQEHAWLRNLITGLLEPLDETGRRPAPGR